MLNITTARKASRRPPTLDIAPLIDMVFILLIFFLVNTSAVKETGIDVNRPTASTATVNNKGSILIAIDATDRIFMQQHEIDLRAVRANIERALAENPESSVVIVADRESSTGTAIRVMDHCRMAGTQNVSLAAGLPQAD